MSETNQTKAKEQSSQPAELFVAPSPHLSDKTTNRRLMLDVIIALIPTFVAALIFFRANAVRLTVICLVSCLLTEYLFDKIRKRPNSLGDFSAVVTGLILAFTLPPDLPGFAAVIGSVVAIAIGKMIFGGLGHNIFNPAMVGRAFLMAAFPVLMTTWIAPADIPSKIAGIDIKRISVIEPKSGNKLEKSKITKKEVSAVSQATPLAMLKPGKKGRKMPDAFALFIGKTGGSLGETSVLAILIGALYLLLRGTIDISIPFGMLGSAVVFGGIAYLLAPGKFANPMFHLGAGGLLFGAFFIATDLVTSPLTKKGRWIFGAGCGILTMIIRQFGTYPEGVMFSVLMMNGLAPLISRWTRPRPLGGPARG